VIDGEAPVATVVRLVTVTDASVYAYW